MIVYQNGACPRTPTGRVLKVHRLLVYQNGACPRTPTGRVLKVHRLLVYQNGACPRTPTAARAACHLNHSVSERSLSANPNSLNFR